MISLWCVLMILVCSVKDKSCKAHSTRYASVFFLLLFCFFPQLLSWYILINTWGGENRGENTHTQKGHQPTKRPSLTKTHKQAKQTKYLMTSLHLKNSFSDFYIKPSWPQTIFHNKTSLRLRGEAPHSRRDEAGGVCLLVRRSGSEPPKPYGYHRTPFTESSAVWEDVAVCCLKGRRWPGTIMPAAASKAP